MIHYHGTPIGGKPVEKAIFFTGKHCLVSYFYQDDLPLVAECCQSFVFDSGAFSVWKKGGTLDLEGYLDFCIQYQKHPGLDWVLIPDVIDGSEIENDIHVDMWEGRYPTEMSVPVWHVHESLERLTDLAKAFPRVALGSSGKFSSPGSKVWWARMNDVMAHITDEHGRPMCKLHGLRMLDPKVFSRLPLASADSVNAAMNSGAKDRFGMYVPPSRAQRAQVIAARIEQYNSAATWEPECTQ